MYIFSKVLIISKFDISNDLAKFDVIVAQLLLRSASALFCVGRMFCTKNRDSQALNGIQTPTKRSHFSLDLFILILFFKTMHDEEKVAEEEMEEEGEVLGDFLNDEEEITNNKCNSTWENAVIDYPPCSCRTQEKQNLLSG